VSKIIKSFAATKIPRAVPIPKGETLFVQVDRPEGDFGSTQNLTIAKSMEARLRLRTVAKLTLEEQNRLMLLRINCNNSVTRFRFQSRKGIKSCLAAKFKRIN